MGVATTRYALFGLFVVSRWAVGIAQEENRVEMKCILLCGKCLTVTARSVVVEEVNEVMKLLEGYAAVLNPQPNGEGLLHDTVG